MPFGFDPSLIFQAQPERLDIAGSLHSGMALGDLIQKRQHEQSLANIYRQNGGDVASLPSSLLKGGFGPEAYAAQDQQAQMAERQNKALQEQIDGVSRVFRDVKDQPTLDAALRALAVAGHPREHVAMLPQVYNEQTAPLFKSIASMGVSNKDAAEMEMKGNYYDSLAGRPRTANTGTGQRMQYNQETGRYDIPVGDAKPVKAAGDTAPVGGGLTQEAVEQAALDYVRTGRMQPLGMGKAAAAARTAIVNRAAAIGGDLSGNRAGYKADTASLAKQQQQADNIDAFENTALKNLDTALGAAKKVAGAGSTLFNAPIMKWSEIVGDPNVAAYKSALMTAQAEISKVLSGANGSVVSDSARHEAQELLKGNLTMSQLNAVADILKQDMANRKAAVGEQIATTRQRASGKTTKSGATGGKMPPNGHQTVTQNGHTFTWNGETGEYE